MADLVTPAQQLRSFAARTAAPIGRGFAISLGAVLFAYAFPDNRAALAQKVELLFNWVSEHLWGIAGVVLIVVAIGWSVARDLVIWIVSLPEWERLVGGGIVVIGVVLVLLDRVYQHDVGPVICIIPFWLGFALLLSPETGDTSQISDRLHRQHMVERLAKYLLELPKNARRVGIVGEWGEGKTYFMRMLKAELEKRENRKTFRMSWVNPWRSSSTQEAWVEIAKGIDRALGFPRLLPQSILRLPGIGYVLELLPKPFTGLTSDVKTLLSSEGNEAAQVAAGLSAFLKNRDQWLLIFVDDMERVGSEQLRKLFPVIDRLIDIERCYFIFAIDPNRVARAFNESSAQSEETKGYLDKVLDVQITLPSSSKADVLEAIESLVDHQACPRLSSVLSSLYHYLPTNPRQAARFLREAEACERIFLDRFRLDEHSYEGFFLLLLMEIQFPSAHSKLRSTFDTALGDLSLSARFHFLLTDDETKKQFEEYVETITKDLESEEKARVRKLIERLFGLSIEPARAIRNERSLDLRWAFEGYRKLIRFTVTEREQFVALWEKRAGTISVEDMLGEVGEGRPFSEAPIAVRQALELELEEVRNLLSDAYRINRDQQSLSGVEDKVATRLGRFSKHANAIGNDELKELDRAVFDNTMMTTWMGFVENNSLYGLPSNFIEKIQELRGEFTTSLASVLPPADRYDWCIRGFDRTIEEAIETDMGALLRKELTPVRDALLSQFTDHFASLLQTKVVFNFFPPEWMRGGHPYDMLDPCTWLPQDTQVAGKYLEDLATKAEGNTLLQSNFVTIITKIILDPYRLRPDDGAREQARARKWIKDYPWYLRSCWKGAWKREPSSGSRKELVRLRDSAIEIEGKAEGGGEKNPVFGVINGLEVPKFQLDPSETAENA